MKQINKYQIKSVHGGLDSGQISYLVVMGTQAGAQLLVQGLGHATGYPTDSLVIKYGITPLISIAATAAGYELYNQAIEPRLRYK